MKKSDIFLLLAVVLTAALLFAVLFVLLDGTGAVAVITVDGEEYARLPLDTDTVLTVSTDYGTNVVVVKDGKVFVSEASCQDKICINTGNASEMRAIVCLPNKLSVSIEGDE